MKGRRVHIETEYRGSTSSEEVWTAELYGSEPGDPIGYGPSEADAVYDLFVCIADREDEEQEQAEAAR